MSALPLVAVPTETELEFDRQVDALVSTGLPELLDLSGSCFRARLEPLRDLLPPPAEDGAGMPFVVVVPDLPVVPVLESVHGMGGAGFTTMEPDDLARFRPLPELRVPPAPYPPVAVDLGAAPLNRTP